MPVQVTQFITVTVTLNLAGLWPWGRRSIRATAAMLFAGGHLFCEWILRQRTRDVISYLDNTGVTELPLTRCERILRGARNVKVKTVPYLRSLTQ